MHAWIEPGAKKDINPAAYGSLFDQTSFNNRTINTGLQVGKIEGKHDVDAFGAASYSIPIELPAGTNGLSPKLGIKYNSRSGSGLLGVGWNITGLSSIYRGSPSLYADGENGTVKLNNDDVFFLDGQRLINIAGVNGANGTEYRTESESFMKIVSNGTYGNGPDWFKVESKEGLTLEYGKTGNSKKLSGGTVSNWNLNKVYDNYGNNYLYEYRLEGEEVLLHKISYNSTDIIFDYVKRNDSSRSYYEGELYTEKYLVKKIRIYVNNRKVESYEFFYAHDLYTYLTEIKKLGSNGGELNSTIFKYGEEKSLFIESTIARSELTPTPTNSNGSLRIYWTGDYDGDGFTDIVTLNYDIIGSSQGKDIVWMDWTLFINNGDNTFTEVQTYSFPPDLEEFAILSSQNSNVLGNSVIKNIDFNGDGLQDIIFTSISSSSTHVDYKFHPYLSNGNGFTAQTPFTESISVSILNNESVDFSFRYVDVDGDGRLDLLTHTLPYKTNPPSNYAKQPISGMLPELKIRFNTEDNNPRNFTQTISFDYRMQHSHSTYPSTPLDIDGNRKSEMVDIYDDANQNFVTISYDGSQFNFTTQNNKYAGIAGINEKYYADFNADGKVDFLEQLTQFGYNNPTWEMNYSTGTGFENKDFGTFLQHPGNYSKQIRHIPIDMNSDGITDILEIEGNGYTNPKINVFLNNGTSFDKHSYQMVNVFDPKSDNQEIEFGDFNGDGNVDIMVDMGFSNGIHIYEFKKDSKKRLLHGISDGFNFVTEFEYEKLTNDVIYTIGSGSSYPLVDMQAPLDVVSKVTIPDGVGGDNITSFYYEGAKFHSEGKGFLGFEKITSENNVTGIRNITEYELNQTYYINNPIEKRQELSATNLPIKKTVLSYTYSSLGGVRVFPYVDIRTETDELTGFTTTYDFTYNSDGNITQTTINRGSIETEVTTNTFVQKGSWIPSKLKTTTSTKTRNGSVAYTRAKSYNYNNEGSVVQRIEDPGDAKAVTTTYGYNAMGNQTSITTSAAGVPSITTTFTYDVHGRYVQSKTNNLNQVTNTIYDYKWGVPKKIIDPSGQVVKFNYDEFGRMTSRTNPDNLTTEYLLTWDIGAGGSSGPTVVTNSIYANEIKKPGRPSKKVWYDIYGRERKSEVDGYNQKVYEVITYDARGNVWKKTTPFYQSGNSPIITTNTYNNLNQLITTSNSAGTASYSYQYSSGNTTTTITKPSPNQSTSTSSKTVDGTGKVITATDPGGTLNYEYYSSGLVKQISMGANVISSMQYDLQGNQTQLIDQNAGTIDYTYDAYGNLKTQTDDKGTTTLIYNSNYQLESKSSPQGTITYTYNTSGNGLNEIRSIVHSNGTEEVFFYDNLGRVRKYEKTIDNEKFTYEYTFDLFGRELSKKYPSGFSTVKQYNSNGYLKKISSSANGQAIWEGVQMNAYGQFTEVLKGDGQTTTYDYDDYGLLEEVNGVLDMDYTFEVTTGNLKDRRDNTHFNEESFEYDQLDRLTKITLDQSGGSIASNIQNIGFQANGNITNKGQLTNYSYLSTKPNAIKGVDDMNDIISNDEQNITFNSIHQPTSISEGNYELILDYGADGQRITSKLKENGNLKRKRVYLPNFEVQTFPLTNKKQEIHYISGGDGLAAIYVIEDGQSEMFFTYTDYLGSILKVTDAGGNVIAEQSFDAWGRKRNASDWTYSGLTTAPDWLYRGYTGHEHYDEFALINMNGRMYDPLLGRMLSPDNYVQDPGNTQSYNRYAYAMNNPLKFTDPNGEFLWVAIIIGAAVGAYIGGASANGWQWNPFKWDWKSGDTWVGILSGAAIGAAAGVGFYHAAPAVASAFSAIGFNGSGTVVAYAITGGTAGYLAGYGAGFVGGLLHDNWNFEYAVESAKLGAQIGFSIGFFVGGLYGYAQGYKPQAPPPPIEMPSSPQPTGGPMIASSDPNYTGGRNIRNGSNQEWYTFNDISDPNVYPGIKIYETDLIFDRTAVTMPGFGIFIHSDITGMQRTKILQHEYGHYLDYLFLKGVSSPTSPAVLNSISAGVNYYLGIGLPSIVNIGTGLGGDHEDFWTEKRADNWARIFFGSNYISP